MLTSTVLAVAVSAIATAENANAVGSSTMAAVPSPCALPPWASPLAAGSSTLPQEKRSVSHGGSGTPRDDLGVRRANAVETYTDCHNQPPYYTE